MTTATDLAPAHAVQFQCCECGSPARWGENVHLLKGQEGDWYCEKHVPENLRAPERHRSVQNATGGH